MSASALKDAVYTSVPTPKELELSRHLVHLQQEKDQVETKLYSQILDLEHQIHKLQTRINELLNTLECTKRDSLTLQAQAIESEREKWHQTVESLRKQLAKEKQEKTAQAKWKLKFQPPAPAPIVEAPASNASGSVHHLASHVNANQIAPQKGEHPEDKQEDQEANQVFANFAQNVALLHCSMARKIARVGGINFLLHLLREASCLDDNVIGSAMVALIHIAICQKEMYRFFNMNCRGLLMPAKAVASVDPAPGTSGTMGANGGSGGSVASSQSGAAVGGADPHAFRKKPNGQQQQPPPQVQSQPEPRQPQPQQQQQQQRLYVHDLQHEILKQGGVAPLVCVLEKSVNLRVLTEATRLLAAVSILPANKSTLASKNCVKLLIQLVKMPPPPPPAVVVVPFGARHLRKQKHSSTTKASSTRQNLLTTSQDQFEEDEVLTSEEYLELQRFALAALVNLSFSSEIIRSQIVNQDGFVEFVVNLLEKSSHHVSIQIEICRLLGNLAFNHVVNQEAIMMVQGDTALLHLLQRHKNELSVKQANAKAEAQAAAVAAAAHDRHHHHHHRHKTSTGADAEGANEDPCLLQLDLAQEELLCGCVIALGNLAFTKVNQLSIGYGDTLNSLLHVLVQVANLKVAQVCVCAIASICFQNPQNKNRLVAQNGVQVLLFVLETTLQRKKERTQLTSHSDHQPQPQHQAQLVSDPPPDQQDEEAMKTQEEEEDFLVLCVCESLSVVLRSCALAQKKFLELQHALDFVVHICQHNRHGPILKASAMLLSIVLTGFPFRSCFQNDSDTRFNKTFLQKAIGALERASFLVFQQHQQAPRPAVPTTTASTPGSGAVTTGTAAGTATTTTTTTTVSAPESPSAIPTWLQSAIQLAKQLHQTNGKSGGDSGVALVTTIESEDNNLEPYEKAHFSMESFTQIAPDALCPFFYRRAPKDQESEEFERQVQQEMQATDAPRVETPTTA